MTTTMLPRRRIDLRVLRLAAGLDGVLLERYERYRAECEADYDRGHRPHYCEHGTNMWTDYDNICGGCEDGWSMGDPLFRMRFALDEARAEYDRQDRLARFTVMLDELRADGKLTDDQRAELLRNAARNGVRL